MDGSRLHRLAASSTTSWSLVNTSGNGSPFSRRTGGSTPRSAVDSTLVPNLRTLQLGVLSVDWSPVRHTALEHLEIRRVPQFALPDDASDWQRVVALPHVHTLILESSYYLEVSLLLSHLQLSEHVDVEIDLDIDTDFEDDAFLALPDILSTDPARLLLLACATSASFASCGFVSVECSAPADGPGRLRAFLNPGSAEEIDEGWHYPPTQAVAHFCALVEHAPLRALELQLVWPYAGETCAAGGVFAFVFSTFPELKELVYRRGANEASDRQLLDVLADDVLPRLRMLRLGEWSGELVSLLVQVLQGRATGGLPLSQLGIQVVTAVQSVLGTALQEIQELVECEMSISSCYPRTVIHDVDCEAQVPSLTRYSSFNPTPRIPLVMLTVELPD
ncbi:hypothetical protein V8D89_000753 [Ganoderma adspersum]